MLGPWIVTTDEIGAALSDHPFADADPARVHVYFLRETPDLEAAALIYPAPVAIDEPQHLASSGREEGGTSTRGGDDFSGLREYQPGDPIKHIAWKQFAQHKGLFTKEYEAYFSAEKWLDWHSLNQLQELRLSGLCYWALHYERQQIPYGLSLPGLTLAPALGDYHLQAVLKALAQFNLAREAGYVD